MGIFVYEEKEGRGVASCGLQPREILLSAVALVVSKFYHPWRATEKFMSTFLYPFTRSEFLLLLLNIFWNTHLGRGIPCQTSINNKPRRLRTTQTTMVSHRRVAGSIFLSLPEARFIRDTRLGILRKPERPLVKDNEHTHGNPPAIPDSGELLDKIWPNICNT